MTPIEVVRIIITLSMLLLLYKGFKALLHDPHGEVWTLFLWAPNYEALLPNSLWDITSKF